MPNITAAVLHVNVEAPVDHEHKMGLRASARACVREEAVLRNDPPVDREGILLAVRKRMRTPAPLVVHLDEGSDEDDHDTRQDGHIGEHGRKRHVLQPDV